MKSMSSLNDWLNFAVYPRCKKRDYGEIFIFPSVPEHIAFNQRFHQEKAAKTKL